MKEIVLSDEIYLINMSKVSYINGFLDTEGDWTICLNFDYDNSTYIRCKDQYELDYIINKIKED